MEICGAIEGIYGLCSGVLEARCHIAGAIIYAEFMMDLEQGISQFVYGHAE